MDTSKEYIRMCEEADGIQGKHVRGNFDEIFFHKGMIKTLPINGFGKEIILEDVEFGYISDIRPKEWNDYCIWLPSQDQLQEMVRNVKKNSYQFVYKLYEFIEEDNAGELCGNPSMEQIWLAFVMKEKYQKTWNGEKWVKK